MARFSFFEVLTIVSLVLIGGCSSQTSAPVNDSATPFAATANQDAHVNVLPELPDTRLAAATHGTFDAEDVLLMGAGEYEVDPGTGAVYLSASGTAMTWAVFGIPPPETGDAVDVDMFLDEGQQAWVAVADYGTGNWRTISDFYDASSTAPQVALSDDFLSPQFQNLYLAIICPPGNFIAVNSFLGTTVEEEGHQVELDEVIFKARYRGSPNPVETTYVYVGQPAFVYAKGFTCDQGHKVLRYNWTISSSGPAKLLDGATTTTYRNRISTSGCKAGDDVTITVTATCTAGVPSTAVAGTLEVK